MRIDAYNQIAQVYSATKPNKANNAQKVSAGYDQVQISSVGKDYQIAKKAVAEASDIREDKVAEMKQKLASGYSVSADDFASKLLEKYNEAL